MEKEIEQLFAQVQPLVDRIPGIAIIVYNLLTILVHTPLFFLVVISFGFWIRGFMIVNTVAPVYIQLLLPRLNSRICF